MRSRWKRLAFYGAYDICLKCKIEWHYLTRDVWRGFFLWSSSEFFVFEIFCWIWKSCEQEFVSLSDQVQISASIKSVFVVSVGDKRMKCWWSWALSLVLINLLFTLLKDLLKDLLYHAHTRPAVTEPLQRSQHRFWTLEKEHGERSRRRPQCLWDECKEGGVRSKVGPP